MSRQLEEQQSFERFERYLGVRAARVEQYLDLYLPPETLPPRTLARAVRYSLFAGGKRLRPVLVLAAAESVGGEVDDALPAAAAFELIHTYSLVHDDLPAMDDDSLRRGQPTSHVVFGEAMAILAGDALQTHAFSVIASPPTPCAVSAERRLRAIGVLAEAAGASGMVGGQVADLESEGKPPDAEVLEFIHRHKTGALIRAAAEVGAIMGGASEDDIKRLRGFGEDVGLAFQIVDDILDVEGSSDVLGKSPGKDEKAQKLTYPLVHGIEPARARASELAESALKRIASLGPEAAPLVALAHRVVKRSH